MYRLFTIRLSCVSGGFWGAGLPVVTTSALLAFPDHPLSVVFMVMSSSPATWMDQLARPQSWRKKPRRARNAAGCEIYDPAECLRDHQSPEAVLQQKED